MGLTNNAGISSSQIVYPPIIMGARAHIICYILELFFFVLGLGVYLGKVFEKSALHFDPEMVSHDPGKNTPYHNPRIKLWQV